LIRVGTHSDTGTMMLKNENVTVSVEMWRKLGWPTNRAFFSANSTCYVQAEFTVCAKKVVDSDTIDPYQTLANVAPSAVVRRTTEMTRCVRSTTFNGLRLLI